MDGSIIVALISAVATILAVIITSRTTLSQMQADLKTSDAVQNTKIDQLKEEVKKHNGFASKIPAIEEHLKDIDHRIDNLEKRIV